MKVNWKLFIFRSHLIISPSLTQWSNEMSSTINVHLEQRRLLAVIAYSTVRMAIRDKTLLILAAMFISMVVISAYLGWSANHIIDQIYQQATLLFAANHQALPDNPLAHQSPLSLLRNMTTYVSLLGALLTMVLGVQIIAEDRRSGVFPLIATRPITRSSYALGKMVALAISILIVLTVALLISGVSLIALPGTHMMPADWYGLIGFYAISTLFLFLFGLLAMTCAALSRSETMGIVIPVSIWLCLTFVLPQLSANINPMAALNPVKAMVAPPTAPFFEFVGPILAPFSFTSIYRDISASLLGFAPGDMALGLSTTSGLFDLIVVCLVLTCTTFLSIKRLDATRSDINE
jgi:ABC-type transport system involved in multi-copper enzyme maturation permease subunit